MATNTEEYVNVSSFTVSIDGLNWNTFESVNGLGVDVEDIAYQSEKNQMLNRPGRFNARDIHLVRRFKNDEALYRWLAEIKAGKQSRKSGSVILKDDEDHEVARFNFFGSWPKSWSGPHLTKDKNGNDLLKEEIVLSVQDLEMAKGS